MSKRKKRRAKQKAKRKRKGKKGEVIEDRELNDAETSILERWDEKDKELDKLISGDIMKGIQNLKGLATNIG